MRKWFRRYGRGAAGLLTVLLMTAMLSGCSQAPGGSSAFLQGTAASAQTRVEDAEAPGIPVKMSGEETEPAGTEMSGTGKESDGGNADGAEAEPGGTGMSETRTAGEPETAVGTKAWLDPDGIYTSREDVSLYLYLYRELPDNFITKNEARALGWEGGSLEPCAPGKCIGGDRFGNYEGLLPEAEGRIYRECDIDTLYADGRGAKRIVYSSDGLIYYTEDHYSSFELLYPGEGD